jgi:putative oxidoreductase
VPEECSKNETQMNNQIDLAMLILRVAAGLMIMMHGYAHVWKGGKSAIAGTAGWFGSMGMRPPLVQAWLASITELGAGALLVLGFLTPLAAAGLFGVMVVAFLIAHRSNGFFIYNPGQGWEYVAMIMAIALAIGAVGGGKWSLDNAFNIDVFRGWRGLATVVIAGGGGALALLATCWRPPAKPAEKDAV